MSNIVKMLLKISPLLFVFLGLLDYIFLHFGITIAFFACAFISAIYNLIANRNSKFALLISILSIVILVCLALLFVHLVNSGV